MESWDQLGLAWASLWCFLLAIASAVFPLLNAEIIILGATAVAASPVALWTLVGVASAGQMVGKCFVYWAGRNVVRVPPGRVADALEKWRVRAEQRPWSPLATVLFSSIVGLPPFYLMTMVAGALRVNFVSFLLAGAAGRIIRFGAVASVPGLVAGWVR